MPFRMDITGQQVRAARALLAMTAAELAAAADVHVATVQRFETGAKPIAIVKTAIVSALERADIEFIPDGVRIKRMAEAAE